MRHYLRSLLSSLLAAFMLASLWATPVVALAHPADACASILPYSILSATVTNVTVSFDGFNASGDYVDLGGLQITPSGVVINASPTPDTMTFSVPTGGLSAGNYSVTVLASGGALICHTTLTVIDFSAPLTPPVPAATSTPAPTIFVRPLITVVSYGASSQRLSAGQDFDWELNIQNSGAIVARNVVVSFEPGDFVPRVTGGLQAVGEIWPGGGAKLIQPFTATKDLASKPFATLNVKIDYTDDIGTAYTGAFTLTYPAGPAPGAGGPAGPTRTPTASPRPQLVITGYKTSPDTLQPGAQFNLQLDVRNLGTSSAKTVSMIVGGGGSPSGSSDGTQQPPGGVSGGSGEFTNFAPLGSSNVQFLGDVTAGQNVTAAQSLIVNTTTNPGAYPFKVSFVYLDDKGKPYTDDQVITLLVRYVPQMEVSFYQDPGMLFAGQPNALPIQIVNLGKRDVTIGKMEVSGPGFMENASITVGPLAPGGYFTLDALFTPDQAGSLELTVTATYVDEFNVTQIITQKLPIEIQEAPEFGPGAGGVDGGGVNAGGGPFERPPLPEETFFEALLRFIKGLLGLGSERETPDDAIPPGENFPIEGGGGGGKGVPIPAPVGPKG